MTKWVSEYAGYLIIILIRLNFFLNDYYKGITTISEYHVCSKLRLKLVYKPLHHSVAAFHTIDFIDNLEVIHSYRIDVFFAAMAMHFRKLKCQSLTVEGS